MTVKAVACAEMLLAGAGAATEVAVVSVKAMLRSLVGA
jgi:hypothetical protein